MLTNRLDELSDKMISPDVSYAKSEECEELQKGDSLGIQSR